LDPKECREPKERRVNLVIMVHVDTPEILAYPDNPACLE